MDPRPWSLVALALPCFLLGAGARAQDPAPQAPASAEHAGADLIGRDVRAHLPARLFGPEARGQPKLVLYRWWTDQCPFCERSLPALEYLRREHEAAGLRTVAVYHPKPARSVPDEEIRARAEKLGYHGPLAADLDWALIRGLWLDAEPRAATSASFLVDDAGVLLHVHPGPEFHHTLETGHEDCLRDFLALEDAIQAGLQPRVTFAGLLDEMIDRGCWTRRPEVGMRLETLRWAADESMFDQPGRGSLVVPGPGVLVRLESATPGSEFEIRVDGNREPVLRGRFGEQAPADDVVPAPLVLQQAGSYRLRVPVPFGSRLEVAAPEPDKGQPSRSGSSACEAHLDVRKYPQGTRVEPLTREILERNRKRMASVAAALESPAPALVDKPADFSFTLSKSVPEGLLFTDRPELKGPRAIAEIQMRVEADDLPAAIRRLVLHVRFDGKLCVSAPLADFFATDARTSPLDTWPVTVLGQGDFQCRWIMPYRERFDLSVDNLATSDVHVAGLIRTIPWDFDERSMHFHAAWHDMERLYFFDGPSDGPGILGPGVLVGESWSVVNSAREFWGTGAVAYWISEYKFPGFDPGADRHGIESLFGFAAGSGGTYSSPHEARSRIDGPDHHGFTALARFRTLDAIPFEASLGLEFGRPLTPPSLVGFAITQYFYAPPKSSNSVIRIGQREIDALPRTVPDWRRVGVLEGEDLALLGRHRAELVATPREHFLAPASWSGANGLRVRLEGEGAWIELVAERAAQGSWPPSTRARLALRLTRGPDHANVRFVVNGVAVEPVFAGRETTAQPPETVVLGTFPMREKLTLRIECLGVDRAAQVDAGFVGIDYLEILPEKEERR